MSNNNYNNNINKYYTGIRNQRGHGLGSIFANLSRFAIPFIKRGAKFVGRKLLRAGINTASDVLEGQNPKESMKKRLRETKDEVIRDVKRKLSTMSGRGGKAMYTNNLRRKRKRRITNKRRIKRKPKKKTKKMCKKKCQKKKNKYMKQRDFFTS